MESKRARGRAGVIILQIMFLLVTLSVVTSAPAEDLITSLPGQPSVTFRQYGGFITVDAENGRALYYYFVGAETNATTTPLTLWLNGGPGCSSLGGAFTELGPFYTLSKSLVRNDKAWNQVSNVLFLESPAVVGFSYSNTSSDYDTGDDNTAQDSLTFLSEWFKKFPEYQQRNFFISGHYGPQLAAAVLKNNAVAGQPQIQLKGLMVFQSLGVNQNPSPFPCIEEQESVINLPNVQSALHATNIDWSMCSGVLNYADHDARKSMLPVLKHIISSGLRLWVFSGDADSVIPLIGTRQLVGKVAKELNQTSTSPYRVWIQGQQVGG